MIASNLKDSSPFCADMIKVQTAKTTKKQRQKRVVVKPHPEEKPTLFAPSSWGEIPKEAPSVKPQQTEDPKIDQVAEYFKLLAKK